MNVVLPALNNIAQVNNYDLVYYHQHGDITEEALINTRALKTDTPIWFSLYNNNIELSPSDMYIPLI